MKELNVISEKLTLPQLAKKLPGFYGNRRFITMSATAHHLSLSWAKLIQSVSPNHIYLILIWYSYIAHLQQQCHNSKFVIFQEKRLKVLKCYNCLWVQRRHNCSPAASFANCVMTLYLFKVHLQTFLSILKTKKCQILSCDALVANERYLLTQLGWHPVAVVKYTFTHKTTQRNRTHRTVNK